jgi:uncharacterized protein YraI
MRVIYRLSMMVSFIAVSVLVSSLFSSIHRRVAFAKSGTATIIPNFSEVKPVVYADLTTNCRAGPGTAYKIVGWLEKGNSTEILGRDDGRHWWYVENPTREGHCWVWAHSTYTDGNTGTVPIVQVLPLLEYHEEDKQCLLTICFSGDDEIIYCNCRPAPLDTPKFIYHNYGCPIFPWLR